MKNIFELIYESKQKKRSVDECDGGAGAAGAAGGDGGGISGGDMSPGGPMGPGGGITSDSVLGVFDPEKGCLGKKDFHIPFPVGKLMRRFPVAKPCCNGGGSLKKRKDKNGKTRTVKNPYAKGIKTIIAEADVFQYEGEAARQFYNVIAPQQVDRIYNDVLYYNDTYKLAWLIKKDGILHMYKPMCRQSDGDVWTIYATHLSPEGTVEFDYKGGRYQNEKLALDAVYKAAEQHRRQLEEALKGLDERCRDEDVVIVCGIKPKRLRWLLNNSRHDVDNFCPDYVRKAIRSNPTAIGAFSRYDSNNALALMTVIEGYGPGTYLHEMTGFVKGGGKQLVDAVISKYKAVWGQVAQVQENGNGKCLGTNQDLLNKFYMKIPALKFYSVENSVFDGAEATFFYTGIADAEFAKFCEDSFGKAGLNESSAGFERIDDIVRLPRIRGIETNQYDISAVPVGLNESAPVVSDQTIDSFSASYYCIFGDPDFRAKVDEIRNSEKYRQMGLGAIQAELDAAKGGGNQINEFALPAVAAYPLVAPAVKIVGGMVAAWLASKVATNAVIPATKADSAAVGQTAAQTTAETVAEAPIADLGTVVAEAPRIPDQHGGGFWKWFLSTSIGGLFGAAGSFIASLFGAGAAAAQTITIGLASAMACGCAALARHLVPVMISWVKKLRVSGVMAYADFESDGDGYRLAYSIRDNRWHMFLRGSRLLNRRANPSALEIQQVMQTEFFKRFRNRCSEILHEYLDDPVNVAVLKTLVSQNKDELKYADELIENRESILARFDAPAFVSEDEN